MGGRRTFMTRTGIENKKLIQGKELEEKNIAQRDRAANKSLVGQALRSASSFLGSVVGGAAKAENDISWYKNTANEMTASANSLALQVFQGSTIANRFSLINGLPAPFNKEIAVYGLRTLPNFTLGDVTNVTDNALNISAQRLFTGLRALNSRVGEYEQGDLMQVFLASSSLAAFIINVGRAIRAAQTFSATKRYVGDAILLHCGFKPGDFRTHLAEYKQFYNQMVAYFNDNIVLPIDFSYAKRELWKAANVFTDQDLACGQVVLFEYTGYFTYDEANARLVHHRISVDDGYFEDDHSYFTDIQGIKNMFHAMYDPLVYSAVLTTMYADIKAGNISLFSLPFIYDDKPLVFQDLAEVKTQIMNAKMPMCGVSKTNTTRFPAFKYTYATDTLAQNAGFDEMYGLGQDSWQVGMITQNTSGLLVAPYTYIEQTAINHINDGGYETLNYYTNEISGDDILTSTRLTARWSAVNNTYACVSGGMDVLIAIGNTVYDSSNGTLNTVYTNAIINTSDYSGPSADVAQSLSGIAQMDWVPEYAIQPGTIVSAGNPIYIQWQLGNPCELGARNLTQLHRVCAISLFSLPIVSGVDSRKVYSRNRK